MRRILFSVSFILVSLPTVLLAQESVYSPLVDLSNAGQGNQVQTFEEYINFLYGMSIAVAALLAVIKIVIAGAKYMMSDVIGNKEGAKTDIQGAILGLLLILSAVIILELINPQLTQKNITFPELQSPRGELHSPAVQGAQSAANGQTNEQFAETLKEGTDDCLTTQTSTSETGGSTIVTANATACPSEQVIPQLSIFERNCESNGGNADDGGRGSKIVTCTTLNQNGISQARQDAARAELTYIKNTFQPSTDGDGDSRMDFHQQPIPDSYIRLNGTTIIVDVRRFCEESYSTGRFATLTAAQQRIAITDCSRDNSGGWAGRMSSRCEVDAVRGIPEYRNGTYSCKMPKQVVRGDNLRITAEINGQNRSSAPINWEEATQACGRGNQLIKTRGILTQNLDFVTALDLSQYDCFRY